MAFSVFSAFHALSDKTRSYVSLALIVAAVLGGVHLLQASQSDAQGQVLRDEAKPGDILMLASTTCIYCARARSWLTEQRVPFKECFIETDPACLAEFQARGGQGTPTLVVRNRTLVGFDPKQVADLLSPRPAAPG